MSENKPEIESYLYDADGSDREVNLEKNILDGVSDKQLLWVNVLNRNEATLKKVSAYLNLDDLPIDAIKDISERPKIDKFERFYRFFVVSVEFDDDDNLTLIPIDFVVGKNFVITIHKGLVTYYREFIEGEKGETQLGELDAESFLASLLDLHIVSYFRALEKIEREIDRLDDSILTKSLKTENFLEEMVKIRSDVSRLRRWLTPQRDVFYALSRPDFKVIADSDSVATFQLLNDHFERCVTAIENSRDAVLSLFDLFATKTAHQTNFLIKRLTFITLLVGGMGVVAGILGMNFEEEFFKSHNAFWVVLIAMLTACGGLILLGIKKEWI